ncbi:MAG: hypothetical protein WD028_09785 [Balneolaceae bacterium]
MNFVRDYMKDINQMTLALRKIYLVKKIQVRNNDRLSYLDLHTIEYDPLVKAIYNNDDYSDTELKQLEFLNEPIFMSMN